MPWSKTAAGPLRNSFVDLLIQDKLVTAEQAAECIRSGDNVVLSMGCAEPIPLVEALVNRKQDLRGVTLHQMLPIYETAYMKPGIERHFRHVSWFSSSMTRPGVKAGRAAVVPGYLYEYPRFFEESLDTDVFMGTVSQVDRHGFASLGISVNYTLPAAKKADRVILVVNPRMPRTHGNTHIHVSQADLLVLDDRPLPEVKFDPPSEEDKLIAAHISELVENGSTLQLDIGTIAQAVVGALWDKKDLGIHTEFVTDAVVDLVETGIVTNRRKLLHPGKIVCTSAMGTSRLYEFLDDNPMIEMRPVSYTNDPYVVSRNANMVAINSASEVDLLGQCSAGGIGPWKYVGTSGQIDFARGVSMSPGGKFFMALRSRDEKGRSAIVPQLRQGTVVNIGFNDVDYVVTEFGIAKLRGKTIRERAEALISIAHPQFADGLREAAKKIGLTR